MNLPPAPPNGAGRWDSRNQVTIHALCTFEEIFFAGTSRPLPLARLWVPSEVYLTSYLFATAAHSHHRPLYFPSSLLGRKFEAPSRKVITFCPFPDDNRIAHSQTKEAAFSRAATSGFSFTPKLATGFLQRQGGHLSWGLHLSKHDSRCRIGLKSGSQVA